jgi:predicted transglutaminase-like cysteine proteinase
MSAVGQLARTFFLVATCWGVAFADGHPRQFSLESHWHGSSAPGAEFMNEFESKKLASPQAETLISYLTDYDTDVLGYLDPLSAGKAPDIQTASNNKLTPFAAPHRTLVPPNALDHGKYGLPFFEPFNLPAMTARSGLLLTKWAELQTRILADENALAACRSGLTSCSQSAHRFLSIVELGRKRHGRARIGWINRAVNLRIKPMSDWDQYGYIDFWASPLQTLSSDSGDCEDYAIVKYAALRELGVAPGDLRLMIVQDKMRQAQHAILAVRDENKWLILDNRTMIILNAEQARQYFPLFVIDYRGVRKFSTVAARR